MKEKFLGIFKNFSYAISSNLISMGISSLVTLIVPKVIGVEDFGYWQLYLFYATYVGFLHLGWNDGIYLKYGGEKYSNLDKNNLFSQFWSLAFFQITLVLIIFFILRNNFSMSNKIFIYYMVSLNLVFANTRFFLLYILQATNKIKDYSKVVITDRLIYFILILGFIFIGVEKFYILIFADLVGKVVSLLFTMNICKDIVFRKFSNYLFDLQEIILNIRSGISLMFANIASSMILGTVRFGIERGWNVETFGKVSLTLSISNLVMRFIIALSLVIYPVLRRAEKDQLPYLYIKIRDFLMMTLLALLIIFFPLKEVLIRWLPEYADSLNYMGLVFPMIVFEGKVALLTNTYLKTLRKEKIMFKVNLITLIFSIIVTTTSVLLLNNLIMAMYAIVLLLAFKSILAEYYLTNIMKISVKTDVIVETSVAILFTVIAWNFNVVVGFIGYSIIFLVYFLSKAKDLKETYYEMKLLYSR